MAISTIRYNRLLYWLATYLRAADPDGVLDPADVETFFSTAASAGTPLVG